MLFKNYHIVIFKDRAGSFRSMKLRGWLGVVLLLLFLGSSGAAVYLWGFYAKATTLEYQLHEAQKTTQLQSAQILSMASTLQDLQDDLRRIQHFDAKLRVMMNVDGGAESPDMDDESLPGDANAYSTTASTYLPLHRQDLLARRMHNLTDQIGEDILLEEIAQQDLLLLLRDNRELLASTPSVWPAEGYLSSRFGTRSSPITGIISTHQGVDIANRIGTPVTAPAKGTVTFAGWDGAYGNAVVLNHGNNLSTRYAHMSKLAVEVGQVLTRGDLIGHIGNTGRSTGPHLHYEVRIGGVPVDPMRYILN